MASTRNPPEVSVHLLKNKDLPSNSVPWNTIQLPIDILLLTANDCEFLSCLSVLKVPYHKSYCEKLYSHVYFWDFGEEEKLRIALVKCSKGTASPGDFVDFVKNAVKVLRPKAVFNVGFCGSMNKKEAKLGDVVVSTKLITYAPTEVTRDGIQDRGVSVPLKKELSKLILSAGDGWKAPLKNPGELDVKVNTGAFLSGPEVVANLQVRNELSGRFSEAIAIDMEGEGLYTAAYDLDFEWVLIKGVSDFADETRSDTNPWKLFASVMAASVTYNILSDAYSFRDWSHYGDSGKEQVKVHSDTGFLSSQDHNRTLQYKRKRKVEGSVLKIKDGVLRNEELKQLSAQVGDSWEKLARRLGFNKAEIIEFHQENEEYAKKALSMLQGWKEKTRSEATYSVLYEALVHKFVARKDLANEFCTVMI